MLVYKLSVKLEEYTWPEVKELDKNKCIIIIPVGSFEQHGYHMPLITDTYIPYKIALLAAEKVKEPFLLVIPPVVYGCSEHYLGFAGTISIKPDTLRELIKDICRSLIHHGFKKLIVLNGHGGNYAALQLAIREIKGTFHDVIIALVNWWELVADIIRQVRESKVMHHADEIETSVALALGLKVYMDKTIDYIPKPFSEYYTLDLVSPPPKLMVFGWLKRGYSGVIGESSKANREKGEIIVKVLIDRLIDLAKRIYKI
ncbi:MAG: hypothetical protein DRJ21_02170 [Candidatus Methanomethylicota archaeon]|uniref:Creatininase family protein n=1 Tax=Thermoproteota archaeon TaxID=2056631 RepID=A0A497ERV3_9CREN|nr:MAG: hypothetical protein DRJ21_02170 [Candidatus Verstraetearchaeota archaeon]